MKKEFDELLRKSSYLGPIVGLIFSILCIIFDPGPTAAEAGQMTVFSVIGIVSAIIFTLTILYKKHLTK